MANYLGIMSVKLGADYATLQSDLGKAAMLNSRYADDVAKRWNDAGAMIGKALAVGVVTGVGALVALTKSAINSAEEIGLLSQKIGISTEALSALRYQAGLANVEIGGLQIGMVKFSRSIAEASAGGKQQAAAFAAMGISIKDVHGNLKPTEELLGEVSKAFASYEDGAEKAALAVELFGKSGADMIPLLNEGEEGIKRAAKEAADYGLIVSGEVARASDEFNDNLGKLKLAAQGFGNQIASELVPSLAAFSGELAEGAKQGAAFSDAAKVIADGIRLIISGFILLKGYIEAFVNAIAAGVAIVSSSIEHLGNGVTYMQGVAQAAAQAAIFQTEAAKETMIAANAALKKSTRETSDGFKADWMAATGGMGDAVSRAFQLIKSLNSEASNTPIMGPNDGPQQAKRKAPGITNTAGLESAAAAAEKLNDKIKKLSESIAEGSQKLADLGQSFVQYFDPMDQVAADFSKDLTDIGHAAADQLAKIEELRAANGDADEAARSHAQTQEQVTTAIMNATAARDLSIDAINKERDVTGRYLQDLADEAKIIGFSAKQMRVESVVLRALAEAKKMNAVAGKEVVKVDEARIRQQATMIQRMEEVADLVQRFGQKSPFDQMSEDIEKAGKALDAAFGKKNQEKIAELTKTVGELRQEQLLYATDAIGQGISSLQSMATEGSKAYKALAIAQQANNLVAAIGAVVNQGNGDPYTAFARMAAMAAAVASLVGSIGSFSGGATDPTAQRQASQGTGTILGDSQAKSESIANAVEITADATSALVGINRGMLSALQNLQKALGAAGGQLARGAGDVAFPTQAGGSLFLGLFGNSTTIIDEGIMIAGGALQDMINSVAVGAFQTVQSNGGFFGGTSTHDEVTDISDEFGRQFALIIGSIADTVREGALALGLLPADIEAALAAYRIEEIRISLQDLSPEEARAELQAVLSSMFDGLAGSIVPFVEQFQQVGEGLGETLVRVATGVQVTQEAMRYLGIAIDEADPERFAQISEGLIAAVGGIDAMIEGMKNFVSAFATDAHRLDVATSELNEAFAEAGLKLPATTEGMWALMQSLDATTEEGQEQIATLLRLASTAAQYYDLIEKAEQSRLEYIVKSSELQSELSIGGGFMAFRAETEQWTTDTIQTLNDLARAAGRAGASERDLVNVHRVAAQRIAQFIAQLKEQATELAVQLGYITQADTLDSLNAQIAALGSASADAGDAIGQAVDGMREKMNLLLGDLSPFNDQRKLELALQGLRDGTVDASTVLEIGRRLYASTSNYTNLFNQVMGMAQFGTPADSGVGGSSGSGRTLSELEAARDALLAAQRPELADQLAHRIAELSAATGQEFADIAADMGFGLEQIAADLSLSDENLQALLGQYLEEFQSQDWMDVGVLIQDAIGLSTDRIVAAITGEPIADVVAASDDRMQAIAESQIASNEAGNMKVIEAINALTSAVVSSGSVNTGAIVDELGMTRRDLREQRLGAMGSISRGREPRVLVP